MSRIVMLRQGLPVPADPRVWREATALVAAGHQVTVIAPRSPGQPRAEVIDGISVRRYRCPAGAGLAGLALETAAAVLSCLRQLIALRLRGRIDVLHAFNPPDTLALLAHLLPQARLVYDQADPVPELLRARGGAPALLTAALARLELLALHRADLVLAVNNTCRQLAVQRGGLAFQQAVVVRIGPTQVALRAVVAAEDQRPAVVVFAGVIGVQDGVEVLLRAAAELVRRRPGLCRFELLGDGPDVPRLRQLVAEFGLTEHVRWAGWLRGTAYVERLATATICVSPDADTEFNRLATMVKITDYLAAGKAAVVADLPESRVTCADAAAYFPPGDSTALARALEELLDDPSRRTALERRARERAPRLLWQHSAERLVAAYEWLLNDGPPVPPEQIP